MANVCKVFFMRIQYILGSEGIVIGELAVGLLFDQGVWIIMESLFDNNLE